LVPLVRQAVIYEVHSRRPQITLLAPHDEFDPACGAMANTEDLDFADWFDEPDNFVIASVECFPGTECWLQNGFDIVTVADSRGAEGNAAIRALFGIDWIGNLLVVKRGRFDRSRAVSITRPEVSMISALVHR
ncbi:hypothetical protein OH77DRAFT_1395663, partial [Trametes cingulata]